MNQYVMVDPETSGSIEKMIGQNLNLNQICKILKSERNIELAHPTLRGYILRKFRKEWDRKNKKWIDSDLEQKHSCKDIRLSEQNIDI